MRSKLQVIAYYLPQYHTIPENDEWWGEGFTEWVNVKKAKPLFKGHKQPNVPSPELGYYNLLDDEVRRKQSELAKAAGIDGFCYWHYWFGNGKELLEKPFKKTLADKENDFGFCLGWANESWKAKQWAKNGRGDKVLIEQQYPGEDDDISHFYAYLEAFKDERYIKHQGQPVFLIYSPLSHPDLRSFINCWNELAKKEGFKDGFCFIGRLITRFHHEDIKKIQNLGCNFITLDRVNIGAAPLFYKIKNLLANFVFRRPKRVLDYKDFTNWSYTIRENRQRIIPGIFPNWDHSPRSGKKCTILYKSTPILFQKYVEKILDINKNNSKLPFLFIKSWNEWGEGNYLEPDTRYGDAYLKALKAAIDKIGKSI